MSRVRKRKKLSTVQLFTLPHAAHTSLLMLNLRLHARKIYATVEIHQDNCFIIQHFDNKAQVYSRKTGGDLYLLKRKLVPFDCARTSMNESGNFVQV